MGATNFPDGITVGSGADEVIGAAAALSGLRVAAGSVVVSAGSVNVSTGLDSVSFAGASPVGPLSSTAGTVGGFVVTNAAPIGASGGSICVRGYDQNGTASVTAGTANWWAIGT